MSKYCSDCGNYVEGSRFCSECGTETAISKGVPSRTKKRQIISQDQIDFLYDVQDSVVGRDPGKATGTEQYVDEETRKEAKEEYQENLAKLISFFGMS
jgi:hypothetical protein